MQAQRWPSIRKVLVYAFLVDKVARATLLDTLYQTFSPSLQMVSVVSGSLATEFIRLHELKCYRNYGSSTTVSSGAYSVGRLEAVASNDRSSSLCNPPSRGLLETNSFWAIDCPGCPSTLLDL